ncbi:amino acid permease [Candidatus Mycolicibacterium alkanivorans]|uniref:Amino acid permease n=1 Tax=Candidatus Mycolicibacterium alkanivorans TaxID=2954114 RepID=A0ABS9YZZ0_9MYCO|nr:amino acid permease [Candidatus Mycolicibacterium alkanivorans]MCI4676813.1 amino acid permease [Candidatus Mycolicibacterium alkanivorans]
MTRNWRTKSVEQSILDTDEPGTRLRKDLTWWDLTVFGVSVVVGAGIFTVTASTFGNITGPAISVSFIIAHGQANLATAFAINGVAWAAKVISIGALAGLTTVVMVLVLGQSRVLFAMSRDGLLPRTLARTGPHGTPVRITVIVAVLIAVAATVFPIGKLEEMVNVGTLFAFVLVSAGVVILRRTRPDLERGFKAPFVPVLPILSIAACVWLMLNLTGLTWIRFGIWMVIGIVVYLAYGRRHSVLGQREAAATS